MAYMSPEQIRGEGVDGRSDLFSLGIILHEMLAGERAFGEGSVVTVMMRILERPPEPLPREIASRIPAELRALLARALVKDRGKRFQSAEELAEALRVAIGEAPLPPARRRRRIRRRLVGGAVALLLAAAAVAAWVQIRQGRLDALRRSAREAYLGGRLQEATRLYSLVIQRGAGTGADYLGRARARGELRLKLACEDLDRARELLPHDPNVLTLAARFQWVYARNREKAEELLDAVLSSNPGVAEARVERINLLMTAAYLAPREEKERWWSAAEMEVEQLRRHVPDDARAYTLSSGLIRQRAPLTNGKMTAAAWERARAACRAACDADPAFADAAAHLSSIYIGMAWDERCEGREDCARRLYQEAIAWVSEAIRRAEEHPAHFDQGARRRGYLNARIDHRDRFKDAEGIREDVEALLALNPTDLGTLKSCARWCTQINAYARAIELYERVLAISTGSGKDLFYTAFAFHQTALGQAEVGLLAEAKQTYQRAVAIYTKALAVDPSYRASLSYRADAYTDLAAIMEGQERAQCLAKVLEDYEAMSPKGQNCYRRAKYYRLIGDYRAALRDTELAMTASKLTTAILVRHARCLADVAQLDAKEGNLEKAHARIEEAVGVFRQAASRDQLLSGPPAWIEIGNARRLRAGWMEDPAARTAELERALEDYLRAIRMGRQRPDRQPEAHFGAAEVLLDLERPGNAVEEAGKAMEMRKAQAAAGRWFRLAEDYERLATILERAGRPEEAQEARERARTAARR
ncbi:MAG: serine/threonine protein kinase [Planctomycetota bacterium]